MTLTNLVYAEFDTTQQNLIHDLRTNILASGSWAKISPTAALLQISAATTAGATTLPTTSGQGTAAGIIVGSIIRIGEDGAADCEYRTVTAVAATTITVAAMTYAHPSGANVYVGNEVLKATTTRGADMIVDLMASHYVVTSGTMLTMAAYQAHTGAFNTGTSPISRYLNWRVTGSTAASDAVHCIVSASKEHLFISLEGPHASEPHTESTTWGSARQYFWMSDLVPYFAGDTTPAIIAGGASNTGYTNIYLGFYCHASRNQDNTASWRAGKLATLDFPAVGTNMSVQLQRQARGDGDWYLMPYVFFDDIDGVRGQLAAFWFAGFLYPDFTDPVVSMPPVGSKVTYSGQTYKLLALNRSSGGNGNNMWGSFGALNNGNSIQENIVLAVPCT